PPAAPPPSPPSALARGAASRRGLLSAGTPPSEPIDTSTPLSSYHVRAQHIVAGKPDARWDRARSGHRDGRGVAAGPRRRRPDRHGTHSFLLQQVDRLNPALHAVIGVSPQAAAEARACDEARARGAAPGPLAGIPILVKDNIAVAGMPATAGSPALAETDQDQALLVTRLREAGAVILGKANLSEWANFRSTHSSSGWSTLGGQAVNPHGTGRNPSGSSSGSGVAVAAGLAPLAVGTETDGSIVCPASPCAIVGISPTLSLVTRAGI